MHAQKHNRYVWKSCTPIYTCTQAVQIFMYSILVISYAHHNTQFAVGYIEYNIKNNDDC